MVDARLDGAVRSLQTSPARCRLVPELRDVAVDRYREVIVRPYRIVFRIDGARLVLDQPDVEASTAALPARRIRVEGAKELHEGGLVVSGAILRDSAGQVGVTGGSEHAEDRDERAPHRIRA